MKPFRSLCCRGRAAGLVFVSIAVSLLPVEAVRAQVADAPAAATPSTVVKVKPPVDIEALLSRRVRYRVDAPSARWIGDSSLLELRPAGARSRKIKSSFLDAAADFAVPAKEALDAARAAGSKALRERANGRRRGPGPGTLGPGEREYHESPDGAHVSLVRNNDLIIRSVETKAEWRVTEDGSEDRLHGVLDWVYQEEVYGRGDFQAHWWSPKGGQVAFLSLDESPVRPFTVIDHVPSGSLDDDRGVIVESTNYPKAGDPNPFVQLSVANAATSTIQAIDLARFPKDVLVVRVGWTPAGDKVVFQVQNRIQTWLELCVADPATGVVTTLIREESPTWVNVLDQPRWLADGSFLWWSERTGCKHIYRYAADGGLIAQVTSGDFPARSILKLDEERGLLWFSGSPDFPADLHAFRVQLDGQQQTQLTQGRGSHRVSLNGSGSHFIDTWSSVSATPVVSVHAADGDELRRFESAPLKFDYAHCPKEIHVVKARDGFPLDVTVIKPLNFDPEGGPYPVWIDTYSGPEAPTVRNSWRVSGWHQLLAHQGMIVLQVNVRTASQAGRAVVGQCYQQFGVQELRDLEDVVKQLTDEPWADASRVGITGWSYGGTMTAFALTHSKLFRLGIAGAGVYDWRLYDTIYTERYMNTPQANKAGYTASSCIAAAKDLHGYLALIHGTMDDNVHLQNTIRFAGALQKHGKDFEMMLYPDSRHGVRGAGAPHLMRVRWKLIKRELLAPTAG